jgi:hypothetical protein
MWRLFSTLGSLFTSGAPAGGRKSPESDRPPAPLCKPPTLAGLEGVQAEQLLPWRALLLRGFAADLTLAQTYLHSDLERIAWSTRCLQWAVQYHGLAVQPTPPVRLHRDNVLLIGPWTERVVDLLGEWLRRFAWAAQWPLAFQQTVSTSPIEQGFFRCLRCVAGPPGSQPTPDDHGLTWQTWKAGGVSLPEALSGFVADEFARVAGQFGNCTPFLLDCYKAIPRERLTHPAFSLICYPDFDMGIMGIEFAGSVHAREELYFWSRPAYYHK